MTEKVIRPIPKYILRMIERADKKDFKQPDTQLRFYAYLTLCQKELVKVTVAVKHYRKKRYMKAVAWHGLHSEECFVKDIEYNRFCGMAYRVGWYDEGIQPGKRWYERGLCYADDCYYDPYAPIVNPEVVDKLPEYRYSAYRLYRGVRLFKYLRLYEKYPQLEMLMKSGLGIYYDSVTILKRIGTDKAFCKWLIRNRAELTRTYDSYYVETIMQAYRTNRPLEEVQAFLRRKKCFEREADYKPIRRLFRGRQLKEFFRYIDEKQISPRLYLDYLKACEHLGLDMSLPQNKLPHDFMRWHDIRIDQYATAKAEADRIAKAALCKQFGRIAEKYALLQHNKRSAFICIIAKSPADLIREGEALDHCVGRMNYDRKMIREESLIFFVRLKEQPDTPLVTVEYSLLTHKVLQCYGEHDHKPSEDILHYVNKVWLPYANKHLKQIQATA